MRDRGYIRDITQCRVKLKELRQAYQKTKESNGRSGTEPQTCRFYAELADGEDEDDDELGQSTQHTVLPDSQDLFITLTEIPSQLNKDREGTSELADEHDIPEKQFTSFSSQLCESLCLQLCSKIIYGADHFLIEVNRSFAIGINWNRICRLDRVVHAYGMILFTFIPVHAAAWAALWAAGLRAPAGQRIWLRLGGVAARHAALSGMTYCKRNLVLLVTWIHVKVLTSELHSLYQQEALSRKRECVSVFLEYSQ
ncbi:hypothetical protein UY3_05977 [Chelonia mydas]|uniref:Myb/SANT-like DNA-binding domain-containing protein n=1 Tax=Chelonia mydas TaxID=8469 RepID=M7BFZ6_CHEMY|nr:hypothetical protein UY3_05977 [Chelonia mydas]